MESTTSNAKLTFDILGLIFNHYAKTETISQPLETLLLVCRSWRDAALGHRALWSHFNIYLCIEGPFRSNKVWKERLPLRLKRCGDIVPLHIDLRHLPRRFAEGEGSPLYHATIHKIQRPLDCPERVDTPRCTCVRDAVVCVNDILHLLAGKNGNLCKRWKSFHLEVRDPADYGLEYKHLATVLRQPMLPNLTSLVIRKLDRWREKIIFPYAPLLQYLIAVDSSSSLPSLQTVRSLTIFETTLGVSISRTEEASNVEELVLNGVFKLPRSLPNLWNLDIAGALTIPDDEAIQLPNLTHLTLKIHARHNLQALSHSRGVNFSRLVSFGVYWDIIQHSYFSFKQDVKEVLGAAKILSIIHGDGVGLSLVLKLIWETEMSCSPSKQRMLSGQRITMEGKEGRMAQLSGDETSDQLCDIATQLGIDSPEEPWDYILHDFFDDDMGFG